MTAVFVWANTTIFKENIGLPFLLADLQFGSAKLQYIPIVLIENPYVANGLTIAAPCLSYCGGGGGHQLNRCSD